DLGGLTEADDEGNRKGAGPHAPLVTAPVDDRRDPDAWALTPDVERPDALGAIHEVRRARQEVDAHGLHVHRNLPDRLRGVRVEDDALLLAELADRGDVLDR